MERAGRAARSCQAGFARSFPSPSARMDLIVSSARDHSASGAATPWVEERSADARSARIRRAMRCKPYRITSATASLTILPIAPHNVVELEKQYIGRPNERFFPWQLRKITRPLVPRPAHSRVAIPVEHGTRPLTYRRVKARESLTETGRWAALQASCQPGIPSDPSVKSPRSIC